jgi:hypothetical protein
LIQGAMRDTICALYPCNEKPVKYNQWDVWIPCSIIYYTESWTLNNITYDLLYTSTLPDHNYHVGQPSELYKQGTLFPLRWKKLANIL